MDGSEDDLVFNYKILGEDSENANKEALNFDNTDNEYEETGGDNNWE